MTRGGVVIDTHAKEVTLAGINRSGSLTLMIPEGLHYAAAGDILAKLKGIGINAVRHTFIIEMVDQILARGHDVSLAGAAIDALGEKDDKTVLADILATTSSMAGQVRRGSKFLIQWLGSRRQQE